MDIKLKNKKIKIGTKVLITYFLILMLAFMGIKVSFEILSKQFLINRARNELKIEGNRIARMIENIPINNKLKFNMKKARKLRAVDKLVEAEITVLDISGRIVYTSKEEIKKEDHNDEKTYITEKVPLTNKNLSIKGYLVLQSTVKNIDEINNVMNRTLLISFTVSGIIAFIIAIMFKENLVRPIYKLMNKMDMFSLKNISNLPDIKTGDEIEQLDETFKDMIFRIKKYDEQQKKFLQNASHELKTPLMSIQGYAEAIKDGIITDNDISDSLDIIVDESNRLKRIVEDIVYLTKLENVNEYYNLENLVLKDIIDDSIKSVKALAYEKGIEINFDNSFSYTGYFDKDKLKQALINILGNGIRYSKELIDVKVYSENNRVKIMIMDDGPGFKNDEETKIFERFYKGEKGNTGIGLSITKAIVEGHRGRIYAYNRKPNGAVFVIEFPIIKKL